MGYIIIVTYILADIIRKNHFQLMLGLHQINTIVYNIFEH